MSIDLFSYAFVEPKGQRPICALHQVPPGVDDFLERHVTAILRRADRGSILLAQFQPRKAKGHFVKLRHGSEKEFLQSAQKLADQLDRATDHRMNRGFFVAPRRTPPKGRAQAAVLKLEGAIYPAPRPESDIAVVDRFEPQYFLESMRVQQFVEVLKPPGIFVETSRAERCCPTPAGSSNGRWRKGTQTRAESARLWREALPGRRYVLKKRLSAS